jgi:hypothetical protein
MTKQYKSSDGPVLIISNKGVHPTHLDKIVDEQREYYNRKQTKEQKDA